jgi:NAD(P)-dependent dehydrogenase (short-subunit alcohol dehydrogenase family)
LAAELGEKGTRVNVIVPGYIETDMTAGMLPSLSILFYHHPLSDVPSSPAEDFSNIQMIAMTLEARSDALNAIPLKRFGEASDIADAAVFLASNRYANNCVLNLDGGLSAV